MIADKLMLDSDDELTKKIINMLDVLEKAVEEGPWDKGLLFKTIGNKLKHHRDNLRIILNQDQNVAPTEEVPHLSNRVLERAVKLEIYVALYCTDGGQIRRWENVVATLGTSIISRPIYRTENDVINMIRSKPNRANEGYCKLFIKETDIAKPFTGQNPRDRLGSELLVLKHGAIKPENITAFIHPTGVYDWKEGRLHKRADTATTIG